jgi:hypothetical protein
VNQVYILFLKTLRKIYRHFFKIKNNRTLCEQDPEKAFSLIYNALLIDKPIMIARFGSTEMACLCNYVGVKQSDKNIFKFINGKAQPWWWESSIINQMQNWSGFFPPQINEIEKFCNLMLTDMKDVDVLGSWLNNEELFKTELKAKKVHLRLLEPFWSNIPWTMVLKDKKVLVVHPFEKSIYNQYNKRKTLFKNMDLLPEFKSLTVIKAVQSLGQEDHRFKDWFEALDYMKNEIDKVDYDICLIGAGAYGFHLSAHVKRTGKKAIHLGGALQLLFGIKGKRWESETYGVKEWGIPSGFYSSLINENWIRPIEEERPKNAEKVENGCYW